MDEKKKESCKADCFAYHEKTHRCTALNALYCEKEDYAFYKKSGKKG